MDVIGRLVTLLKWVGGVALVLMMVLSCFDVVTRYFGVPIFGAVEFVSLLATLVLACSMPQTHVEKGHVGVDLFVRKFSPRSQHLIDGITNSLAAVVFSLVCWQMFVYAASMERSGEVSMSLQFPTYIFIYAVAVAFGVLGLVIVVDAVNNLHKVFKS